MPAELREPVPLLPELHGRGIPPIMFDRWTGFSALADEQGFALAMPSAVGEVWNDGRYRGARWPEHDAIDDVGYLLAVVDDKAGRQAIDSGRIYIIGMSNGATMAGRLAWERAERIAVVAQVAGTAAAELIAPPDAPPALPLVEIHGTRDRSMPYEGGRASLRMRLLVRRPSTPVLGVDEWVRRWVERNGAAEGPLVEAVGPDATVRRWRGPTRPPISRSTASRAAGTRGRVRACGGRRTWAMSAVRSTPRASAWNSCHRTAGSCEADATAVSASRSATTRRARAPPAASQRRSVVAGQCLSPRPFE